MKYKATITVDYEFEVESSMEFSDQDIEDYKKGIQAEYFEGFEEIEDEGHIILSELENAIFSHMPRETPYTRHVLKIKPDMYISDMDIKEVK